MYIYIYLNHSLSLSLSFSVSLSMHAQPESGIPCTQPLAECLQAPNPKPFSISTTAAAASMSHACLCGVLSMIQKALNLKPKPYTYPKP